MFENFKSSKKNINNIKINYRIGGNGPPILLLHGYPQTHIMWRKVANKLSKFFNTM